MSALRPYHQFLGNGIDAVLLGATGGMTAEAAQGLDRCYWYKADTYYADARRYAPGDDPWAFLAAPPGGTNCQLAPLGRAWFELLDATSRPLPPLRATQQFAPATGLLSTRLEYAGVTLDVQTALAADLPALLFDLSSNADMAIALRACAAPGLWPEDTEQVEPTSDRAPLPGPVPGWRYQVGAHTCHLRLVPVLGGRDAGADDQCAWLGLAGRHLRWWVVLECSHYADEEGAWQRLPDIATAARGDVHDGESGAGAPGGLNPAASKANDPLSGLQAGVSQAWVACDEAETGSGAARVSRSAVADTGVSQSVVSEDAGGVSQSVAVKDAAAGTGEDRIPDVPSGSIVRGGDLPQPTAVGVVPAIRPQSEAPPQASFTLGLAVVPQVDLPDEDYQRLHSFSMYMFHAMQHRYSGGLPVNNLRRTFNSHVFWDGAFVQRALLEAGHTAPAREAWRFLTRTREAAAANAQETFGAPGLHWDWETTHRGERAYVPWLQQRYQVHNTPLLAHMIVAEYAATRDVAALAEGYDLLVGAASFLLHAVLVEERGRLVTRPLVGSHEAAQPVVNDGATVAASLRLLLDVALAARVLGRYDDFARRCAASARLLRRTMASLFNGRYFQASRDEDRLNTSSLAPIYPAGVIAPTDPRALATVAAYQQRYQGRMAGHGNSEHGFPWSAGILARLLAYQGRSEAAWQQLDLARVALCAQGGCAEYVDQGQWNLQYFSTAQAALCSALHALLVQSHGATLRLFPALPPHWDRCGFRDFLVGGIRLDARYERGAATVTARNACARPRRLQVRFGDRLRTLMLDVDDQRTLEWEDGHE